MTWNFEKFREGNEIYAICPKCGFSHVVGSALSYQKELEQKENCPNCGERLLNDTPLIEIKWNLRSISEFQKKD